MAAERRSRCGALCQHPGCWKSTEFLYRVPSEYVKILKKRKNINSRESIESTGSYTEDGLPTLAINTLECTTAPFKSNWSSDPEPSKKSTKSTKKPHEQKPKIVHYNQLFLEDNDEIEGLGISYVPVLLWNPGSQRESKTNPLSVKQPDVEFTKTTGSNEVKKFGTRDLINMTKTDLTDALPPPREAVRLKEHVGILQKFGLADAASLSCLNDVDLPEPVLKEILNQLRSESSMSLIESPQHTVQQGTVHQIARVHRNSSYRLTPQVSTRMKRSVCNLSPSRVTKEARRQSPQYIKSFSRQLSIKPLETLQRLQATTRNIRATSQNDEDILLNDTYMSSKTENLLDLLPYSRQRGNKNGPIVIPHLKKNVPTLQHVAQPNLSLDPLKKTGYRPAFKHRKGRISPTLSDLDFSEESSIGDEFMVDLPKLVSGPRAPANSCCDSSMLPSIPQSRATQSLMTPLSPDYMRMSAKLSSGKLILTDRRKGRIPSVRKLTMSDSELNADSDLNVEHNFLPSPVQELNDDELVISTNPVNITMADKDDDYDDDVFEVEKKDTGTNQKEKENINYL